MLCRVFWNIVSKEPSLAPGEEASGDALTKLGAQTSGQLWGGQAAPLRATSHEQEATVPVQWPLADPVGADEQEQ